MDDAKIIESIRNGDVERYTDLVRAHQARIRLLCLSMLLDAAEADDAAQDAFVKAFEGLSGFLQKSSFGTWISRIAANECRDRLRSRKQRRTESLDAMTETCGDRIHELIDRSVRDPDAAYTNEDLELLRRVLAALPEEERDILNLREFEELSYDEIASRLQCSLDAVKGRLKRARQHLTDQYSRFLGDTSLKTNRL